MSLAIFTESVPYEDIFLCDPLTDNGTVSGSPVSANFLTVIQENTSWALRTIYLRFLR